MKFRRILATLLLVALPFAVINAQEIRSVKTVVTLNHDGSADVRQTWDATVVSGTEWYIPVTNLGKMKISDFSVSEDGVEYVNEGRRWDVDRSLAKKAGRCGIVDKGSDGVELCWGQGSYGPHVWVCSYHISGLVQSLEDYDAFNHQFVNPGLIASPQYGEIRFINNSGSDEWSIENTGIWGFGFDGDINIEDGEIVARSSGRIQSMIVMVRFDKAMFEPEVSRSMSFEQMREKAFKRSSYNDGNTAEDIFFMVLVLLIFGLFFFYVLYVVISIATGHKYKKSLFGDTKITDWYREAPLGNKIHSVWYIYSNAFRFVNEAKPDFLVGTYFLRWILDGALIVRQDPVKKNKVSLEFTDVQPDFQCEEERDLYNMSVEASGDMILEASEFKIWSRKHYEKLLKWPDEVKNAGYATLVQDGYINGRGKGNQISELRNVIGFRNFLNDFTLSNEREAGEVKLWKDYLVYAQMFGIADKVAKQFKSLYPEFFQEVAQSTGMDVNQLMYMIRWTNAMSASGYSNAVSKQQAVAARNGQGGHTSFGGGGGFSGGGFGGGSR